jgi:hypothetical protein
MSLGTINFKATKDSRTCLNSTNSWIYFFVASFLGIGTHAALAYTPALDPELALKNCLAAQSDVPQEARGKGLGQKILKGLGSEAKASTSGMAKDLVFVFSVQDVDPYAKSAPKDKPYVLLSVRLVDGSMCDVVKYPDDSDKIVGGFADGTIIAPIGNQQYVVGYPNGTRGRLKKLGGDGYKIYRPDNTITTLKKTASGRYSIRNTKLGYMGEAVPDRNGIQFEFKDKTLL